MSLTCGGISLFKLLGRVSVNQVLQSDVGRGNVVYGASGKVAGVGQLHHGPGGDGGLPGGHARAGLARELLPLDVIQHGLRGTKIVGLI